MPLTDHVTDKAGHEMTAGPSRVKGGAMGAQDRPPLRQGLRNVSAPMAVISCNAVRGKGGAEPSPGACGLNIAPTLLSYPCLFCAPHLANDEWALEWGWEEKPHPSVDPSHATSGRDRCRV